MLIIAQTTGVQTLVMNGNSNTRDNVVALSSLLPVDVVTLPVPRRYNGKRQRGTISSRHWRRQRRKCPVGADRRRRSRSCDLPGNFDRKQALY